MSVAQRLELVRERIAESAARAAREPGAVTLVGVSKGASAEAVIEAAAAGLLNVGENRVQEASDKIPAVEHAVTAPLHWHLIGHLQSNKARSAAELFATIQSIDSVHIAERVSRAASRLVEVFLEVRFVDAPDRFGFTPEGIPEAFEVISGLPNLNVAGLMTVAPLGLEADSVRSVFRRLRELRDQLQDAHPELPQLGLSMGMTDDYTLAIEEGATLVRIGRAIFTG